MTPKMRIFAAALAAGNSGVQAARLAGYPDAGARAVASKLRRDPRVKAEIERIRAGDPLPLHAQGIELTPLDFLLSIMGDPTQDPRIRVRAATAALASKASTVPNPKRGKKEMAQDDARTAHIGTSWEELLAPRKVTPACSETPGMAPENAPA